MITVTVPHPDPGFDERHGAARWTETLDAGHRVWHCAGRSVFDLDGKRASDCQPSVRNLIVAVLADPASFGPVGHLNLPTVTANLTRLFFMLGQRPEGTVQVTI